MAADIDKVREIAERVAASQGLEVLDVEFRGGAGAGVQGRLLRITIDRLPDGSTRPDQAVEVMGVTHEDCANVSREVSTILDVEDAIVGGEYLLEVSSPGLDRKLTREQDFRRFVGSRVKLMTKQPVGVTETSQGNRHFEGRLESFENGTLTLNLTARGGKKKRQANGTQRVAIALENIERANLVPEI
jgi:ribosome maturation factor RimP